MFEIRLHRSYVHPFFRCGYGAGVCGPAHTSERGRTTIVRAACIRADSCKPTALHPDQRCLKQIAPDRACTGQRAATERHCNAAISTTRDIFSLSISLAYAASSWQRRSALLLQLCAKFFDALRCFQVRRYTWWCWFLKRRVERCLFFLIFAFCSVCAARIERYAAWISFIFRIYRFFGGIFLA